MPKIINAYSGNESVQDNLGKLADSMFGDQAKNEVYRQTAKGKARENENIPLLADALSRGDYTAATRAGVMADRDPKNVAGYGQYYGVMKNGAGSEAGTRATMAVPGADYGHTVQGTQASEANRRAIASEATNRAAATQLAIAERAQKERDDQFNRTPESVQGPDGKIIFQPRSQAMGMPTGRNVEIAHEDSRNANTTQGAFDRERYKHDNTPYAGYDANGNPAPVTSQAEAVKGGVYTKPLSTDEVTAGALQTQLKKDANAEPGSVPSGYLHPLVQDKMGYGKGAVPYQHLQSGAVGQSYDGGKTIDGHPAGPGWVPVSPEGAITQTRTNAQIDAAGKPLPPVPGAYPQAAQDAGRTSGLGSVIQHGTNATWGMFGGGEVGADSNRARENLTNLANEARTVVLSSPGRAAVQAQKWANLSIPQPGALGMTGANADQQRNAVVSFTQHLRQMYAAEAAEAQDRTTAPDLRQKILSHMVELKRVIAAYEQPAAGATPQSAQPGAPAAQSAAPQGGGAPPVAGARQAPDGKWYVQQGGKFFRVDP